MSEACAVSGRAIWDLPTIQADYIRYVTRGSGTGQPRWLGDLRLSFTLFNWAHLYQCLRRGVPDELYRGASAVEPIEAGPHGTTTHLRPGAGTPLFTGEAPRALVQRSVISTSTATHLTYDVFR